MTNLSRRRFFGLLGGAAATYFLPPIGGWKSDVIASPYNVIPGECLFLLGASDGMLWWSKDKDWILKPRSLGPPVSESLFAHREMFVVEGFKQ